ncbi:MAG: ice-binding family protein [Anaerolineales bacterium]|nr:ice-binding family protein [Anaerolineales bacterium]
MHKVKNLAILIILIMGLSLAGPLFDASAGPLAQTSPTLGDAESYSVLGGESVTNTGSTTMPGDLGVSPGSSVTGFPPGTVGGTIHAGDADAAAAQADNTAAFGTLDQGCTQDYGAVTQDLAGLSLSPGVYCADAFTLTANLTLSGSGVWIFKSDSTLITSSESSVTGGDPCNVWWRVVSSATLGTDSSFIGNILADTSISLNTGATLDGRAFARTGSVTLDNNIITGNACLPPAPTATAPPAPTATAPPAPTAPSTTPVVGLPDTGGAPIRNNIDRPWSLVIVGGFTAIALALGVRGYRRSHLPKQ